MAFDATVGGADANSYVSVEDADDYFSSRLYSDLWTSAVTGTKQSALVTATTMLEEIFTWNGQPATTTQALHWPAQNAYDCNGDEVDDTIIPTSVKNAVCEQALYLLRGDTTQTPDAIMKGLKSASVGSLSAVFDSAMTPEKLQSRITTMLRCYGVTNGSLGGNSATSAYVIRG